MVWTFVRGHDRLEVRREATESGAVLIVSGAHPAAGSTAFPSMMALIQQQSQLEATLLDMGWSLASFEPERRSHGERRAAQRDTLDRRRWWTDPAFRKSRE
jgi:hypothetical protein